MLQPSPSNATLLTTTKLIPFQQNSLSFGVERVLDSFYSARAHLSGEAHVALPATAFSCTRRGCLDIFGNLSTSSAQARGAPRPLIKHAPKRRPGPAAPPQSPWQALSIRHSLGPRLTGGLRCPSKWVSPDTCVPGPAPASPIRPQRLRFSAPASDTGGSPSNRWKSHKIEAQQRSQL